jgi:hypothetical protein
VATMGQLQNSLSRLSYSGIELQQKRDN